jgi:hypothetical protein
MTMPNFFVVGAQKAGTTSLYHYLNQHPEVYMSPRKEPFFFDHELNAHGEVVQQKFGGPGDQQAPKYANIRDYEALFAGAKGEKAIGEASPLYIYAPGTAGRIKRYVPEAKLVALLRNPADRAYSAFLHARRIGKEPFRDFGEALRQEEGRIRDNWHYLFHYRNRGLYYAQLERYYEFFEREVIGIWLYEDLRDDPAGVVQSVFRFLGVDDEFVPDTSSRHNPARVPKNEAARVAVKAMMLPGVGRIFPSASRARRLVEGRIFTKPPSVDPETRRKLIEGYRADIGLLQEAIGRDLSGWLR